MQEWCRNPPGPGGTTSALKCAGQSHVSEGVYSWVTNCRNFRQKSKHVETMFQLSSVFSFSGKVLPPRNLSALWENYFNPGVSWEPPEHSEPNCCYKVKYVDSTKRPTRSYQMQLCGSSWSIPGGVMEGGPVIWSVVTVCNGVQSQPAVLKVSYPELVTDLKCFLSSVSKTSCEWTPRKGLPDLRFFYELRAECRADSALSFPSAFRECSSYTYTKGEKTGCDLKATKCHVVFAMVNGTLENRVFRNTFERLPKDDVRLRRLTWTVTELKHDFNISWTLPEVNFPEGWVVKINYTECDVKHQHAHNSQTPSYKLVRVPRCWYEIAIRAENSHGWTAWSEWKYFDKKPNVSNVMVYVTIIIPMVIGILAALTCVAFQKNKDKMFPPIPEPKVPLVFSTPSMFVPEEEEECCEVTEVVGPADS